MLINLQELLNVINKLKESGKKIVFTNGCFDIIHAGHIAYLNETKALGDVLIVGLNTDNSTRRLKGAGRPVNNQDDRAAVLSALKPVDYVVYFNEDTPLNLVKAIKPDVLAKGGDYNIDSIVGADVVLNSGGEVKVIPFVEGKSTTAILKKIMKL